MKLAFRRVLAIAALVAGAAACDDSSTSVGLTPPLGLTATPAGASTVRLTWNAVVGATGYEVERASSGDGVFTPLATVTTTTHDDAGIPAGTQYRYRVRASNGTRMGGYSAVVTSGSRVRVLSGNITSSTTLSADTVYVLSGYVKVTNNAVLTIQPGTTIMGDSSTTARGSSLWILRGSRIIAEGTADRPIVFTSQRAPGDRRPGDWGGIIIVGRAPINRTADPILTEGPTGFSENYAGGTDFNDNSGSLRYVRIEFAGYDVSNGGGQELNGLSMYAVGRGTRIEYVQVLAGLDDSFEWWGGAVDGRYLVSYESGDDHFDWTEGYQGRNQFVIALQTAVLQPRSGAGTVSSDPRGFEADGCEREKAGCTYANRPYSAPVFANFTLVGPGTGVFTSTDGSGAVLRRGTAGTLVNGVIARWPGTGISLRDAESNALRMADSLMVRNVLLVDNGANFEAATSNFGAALADASYNNASATGVAALFPGIPALGTAPTQATLDFTPSAAASAGGMTSFAGTPVAGRVTGYFGGTLTATTYRGAADPAGAKWWNGWTSYSRN